MPEKRERLLILEPEDLVRWSLATYLDRWFDAITATKPEQAICFLKQQHIDAAVISDDLPRHQVNRVIEKAVTVNPNIRIVRTIANPNKAPAGGTNTRFIEKPFDLSKLARLLLP